jgi:hypothetical protein
VACAQMSVRGRGLTITSQKLTKDATTGESTTHSGSVACSRCTTSGSQIYYLCAYGSPWEDLQSAAEISRREIASPSSNAGPFLRVC